MILMYHKVYLESPSIWWVTVNNFYRQMVEISNKEVVYLDDYNPKNPRQVVITFDGIYDNVLFYAAPILESFGYPFELFLTSKYIGKDNAFDSVEPKAKFASEQQLSQLVKMGGRLQWHTKTHINLKEITDLEVINLELSVPDNIKTLDNEGFNWFAYPHGEFNSIVLEQVKKQFRGALSCNQGNNDNQFELNRLTVVNNTKLTKNTIACIIASYNYGDFLIEAIESVLKQTLLPDEILITDDCSDDDTQIIAESYVKRYPKLISYNRNETNLGVVNHFNKAINLTTSNYIFFLGADNRLLSNYVEKTAQVLDSSESVGIAYTDYAFFGSRAQLTYKDFYSDWKGEIIDKNYFQINFPEFKDLKSMQKELIERNFIHGTSMYKRICFDEVGGYIKTSKPEDHNLFARIVNKGWLAIKAKNTNLEYRQHSVAQVNNLVGIMNKMQFYKSEFEKLKIKQEEFEKSKLFGFTYRLFKLINGVKKNYKRPKKLMLLIVKKIKSKLY